MDPVDSFGRNKRGKRVTQELLSILSRQLNNSKFEAFSFQLGFSYNEAQNILVDSNYQKAFMKILMSWKDRTGGFSSELAAALEASGLGGHIHLIDHDQEYAVPTSERAGTSSQNPQASEGNEKGSGRQHGGEGLDRSSASPSDRWQNCHVKQAQPSIDDLDDEMKYVMWKPGAKGNALIIGNSVFPVDQRRGLKAAHRPWAEKDITYMANLLKKLGYDFKKDENIKRNLSKEDIDKAVQQFTEQLKHDDPQSAVVYISSHGDKNGVEGTDRDILFLPVLLKHFSGVLLGKPKVLIIDACWGNEETSLIPVAVPNSSTAEQSIDLLPENADIFMIHSTSYGKMAWSNDDGSWLVNQMCKVFYNTDRELEDLDTIMLRVTKEIHSLRAHQLDDKGNWKMRGTQSTTVVKQGVTRKLFFFPGYSLDSQSTV